MANAAAKKSKLAQQQATTIYQPILVIVNIIYIVIRIVKNWKTYHKYQFLGSCVLWALTLYSYKGIVYDYANSNINSRASSSSSSSSALPGGDSLDLLGLTLCIQFGTALWSNRFWWGLAIVPPWYGYILYNTFRGALGGVGGDSGDVGVKGSATNYDASNKVRSEKKMDDDAADERRKKRSEKRRIKRA